MLSAGPTPHTPLDEWTSRSRAPSTSPVSWSWEEFLALPSRDVHRGHPLRDQVVEARHHLDRRLGRHTARRASRPKAKYVTRVLRRRLHDEPAARGPRRRAGRGSRTSTTASRSSPSTADPRGCSSRTCTSGRAPSGCAESSSTTTTSPASGSATATTTTVTPGKSSGIGATELARPAVVWRYGTVTALIDESPHAKTIVLDVPDGQDSSPVSTSTSALRPRTDIRRSAPTRSPQRQRTPFSR